MQQLNLNVKAQCEPQSAFRQTNTKSIVLPSSSWWMWKIEKFISNFELVKSVHEQRYKRSCIFPKLSQISQKH